MMKKTFATIAAAALLLSSCEDFLNVKPRGADVASRLEHYEGLLYGAERYFLQEAFPHMCFETFTDQGGFDMAYSQIGSFVTNAYMWSEDIYREDQICGEWNSFTGLLYSCNKVIAEVLDAEDGTPEQRLAVQAEARVMRAYMVFMMHQFFGRIPVMTEASTMTRDLPLRSEEYVRSFVLREMEEAVPSLAEREEHMLRVFKPSGHGLYGKILFMMGRYEEASAQFTRAFELLRSVSPATRLVDFNALMDASGNMQHPIDAENTERLFNFIGMPRLWEAVYGGMYSHLLFGVKNELLEKYFYDMADTRLSFFSSVSTGVSAYSRYVRRQQYCANLTSSNISTNFGLELSELYTMQAECLARAGDVDGAGALLLEFRRHRLSPGHEALPAEIQTAEQMTVFAFDERMREQIGFGSSWFDMKRLWNDPLFQDLKQYYVHTVGDKTYTLTEDRLVMKIPPTVLAWHPEYAN